MDTKLQKNIMRRVYYTAGIRLATHSITKHVVVLVVLGYALKELVHVARIFDRVSGAELGELGVVMFRMFTQADWPTLVVLGLAIFTALSLRINIRTVRTPALQVA